MVTDAILHCCSPKHYETSEDALRLVPEKARRLEYDVIETREELANVKKKLKQGKHNCLIMRMEHPRAYEIR